MASQQLLTSEDAFDIFELLISAQNGSRYIGGKWRIPQYVIDEIHQRNKKARDCLFEIITQFLNGVGVPPTWRAIVEALKSPTVNLLDLAQKIEQKYCQVSPVVDENGVAEKVSTTMAISSGFPNQQKYYNLVQTKENVFKLEKMFKNIQRVTVKLLQQKQIGVDDILLELAMLNASEQAEHVSFFEKNFPELEKCLNHIPLFVRLNRYWNYLSPQLLYHVIDGLLESTEAQTKKEEYDTDLGQFRNQTLLTLFCEIDTECLEVPEGFTIVVARFEDKVSQNLTLQSVENFRQRYAKHHKLRNFALMLFSKIKRGSFVATFTMPKSIIEIVLQNSPASICEEFGVSQLDIAGKRVYDNLAAPCPEVRGVFTSMKSKKTRSMDKKPQVNLVKIKEKFKKLKKSIKEDLDKNKVPLKSVIDTLMSLPADAEGHLMFSDQHRDLFDEAADHFELFGFLNSNINPLSYSLLKFLAGRFELKETKVALKEYASMETNLKSSVPVMKERVWSSSMKKIFMGSSNPSGFDIGTLESFRCDYSQYYNLKNFAMVLVGANFSSSGSSCSWFIPESIVEKLKMRVPRFILIKYGIIRLEIEGTCVYRSFSNKSLGFDLYACCGIIIAGAHERAIDEEEYPFIEKPGKDYFCPVTYGLIRQPYLTSCCGKHFSEEAISQIGKQRGACPLCKSKSWSAVLNKEFQRQVNSLQVFCHNDNRGCRWRGELSAFDDHVKSCRMSDAPLMEELLRPISPGNAEMKAPRSVTSVPPSQSQPMVNYPGSFPVVQKPQSIDSTRSCHSSHPPRPRPSPSSYSIPRPSPSSSPRPTPRPRPRPSPRQRPPPLLASSSPARKQYQPSSFDEHIYVNMDIIWDQQRKLNESQINMKPSQREFPARPVPLPRPPSKMRMQNESDPPIYINYRADSSKRSIK